MVPELIPVRLSHLLRHCSVGAIVRGPEYLMTVMDIRKWTDKSKNVAGRAILYVERVRSALDISQELREPPIARELENGHIDGAYIPAMRFPGWMYCPNRQCGFLYSKPWQAQNCNTPHCTRCEKQPELEQTPWILVHHEGYMADVPWHYLAHNTPVTLAQRQCRPDWQEAYLQLGHTETIKRTLFCARCNARGYFDTTDRLPYGSKIRPQPWIHDVSVDLSSASENQQDLAEILEINDARVHSATTRNALVIPPESRMRRGTVVDHLYRSSEKLQQLRNAKYPLARKGVVSSLAKIHRCSLAAIEDAYQEIQNGYPMYGKELTPGLLLEDEYRALLDTTLDTCEDEDFVTKHHTSDWQGQPDSKIIRVVSHLVAVDRLKEIQIMMGFQRLGGKLVRPDITGESAWLPALELYGEGIFFTLAEDVLCAWEMHPKIKKLANAVQRRFVRTNYNFEPAIQVSPRFLLLHTLAHLLIRQLETKAGYSAASLKERIYSTTSELPMAGILIYVAVPDIVGSLGGLAELAASKRFLTILTSVFEHADWCSLDPVCGEHEGQGPGLLNRAACHACTLIPEPSCAFANVLLDRTFIRGSQSANIPAFLDGV